MTLKDLNNLLERASLACKSVNEYEEGDVYVNLNSGEHKYGFVNWTINSVERTDNTYVVKCYLFYIDRLLEDNSNKLDIWSTGCRTLQQILMTAENNASDFFQYENTSFTNFTEKFSDLCAGVYLECDITIINEVNDCLETQSIEKEHMNITTNGIYNVNGDYEITVNVNGGGSVELETLTVLVNGEYTPESGKAYGKVIVDVPNYVPEGTKTVTQNGTYNIKGYEFVEVNVDEGITPSGTLNITENGTYDVTVKASVNVAVEGQPSGSRIISENGTYDVSQYAQVHVGVRDSEQARYYVEMISDMVSSTITLTANGTYDFQDEQFEKKAYGKVVVNVPGADAIKLTQAEYDAMREAGTLESNKLYLIQC